MTVRLYGRDVGNGSLAVVTRGFRQVLEGAGLLEGFVALDKGGGSEEQDAPPGALARDGVFTGNTNMVRMMLQGARHERHWVTVTPNSTCIPKDLLAAVVALPNPHILSASAWGTQVILDTLAEMGSTATASVTNRAVAHLAGGKRVDVLTVHHGVSGFAPVVEEIEKTRADYERGEFRVVHFSTTEGERKGTLELVQAWKILRARSQLSDKATLLLVLDDHAARALRARMVDARLELPEGVRFLPRGNLDAAQMSRLLCHMHLLAAPSRGEGFGMICGESRACGVPTLSTRTTGHSAGHCDGPGTAIIRQSDELFPIDDGPGAMAPRVEPAEIAGVLHTSLALWRYLSDQAVEASEGFRREWNWEKQLAPLVGALR